MNDSLRTPESSMTTTCGPYATFFAPIGSRPAGVAKFEGAWPSWSALRTRRSFSGRRRCTPRARTGDRRRRRGDRSSSHLCGDVQRRAVSGGGRPGLAGLRRRRPRNVGHRPRAVEAAITAKTRAIVGVATMRDIRATGMLFPPSRESTDSCSSTMRAMRSAQSTGAARSARWPT